MVRIGMVGIMAITIGVATITTIIIITTTMEAVEEALLIMGMFQMVVMLAIDMLTTEVRQITMPAIETILFQGNKTRVVPLTIQELMDQEVVTRTDLREITPIQVLRRQEVM
jgi:hypothetical protein